MLPILVVDDDAAVRRVAVRALSASGFDVLEARDGVAAVQVVEQAPDAIQLVLTDLHMPRMSGVELIRVLNERWPAISVLAMTGYSDEREAAERLLGSALQVLSKPFTLVELNAAVRAAVTRASAA
jgi:CheY-like chemotaxis protein